ncbi:MAG: response regulator [Lachnospiraceae bacterium]|nr:response regulator [Lachnospiraceae bacterium]
MNTKKKKQHVLLVDDEELNRTLCERIMVKEGYSVSEAEDGREAVELMQKSPLGHFDLIIMDIQMPNMNGYEATRQIRNMDREDAKNIPIIALSADDSPEDVQKSKEYGMNAHMSKPFNIPKIIDVVKEYLQ